MNRLMSSSPTKLFGVNCIKRRIVFTDGCLELQFPAARQYGKSAPTSEPERTALYDFHKHHGGKIVNFGGYALPVQYADDGIVASHLHTRRHASIFDVSHMLQTFVRGKHAIDCIESICTADMRALTDGNGTLTVFTNTSGGILDDLIVNRIEEHSLYVVSNAAMKQQDMDIMRTAVSKYKAAGKDVDIEFLSPSDQSLIAVQGPDAVSTLAKLLPSNLAAQLAQLCFMQTMASEIAGVGECRITRCGYTGEDGVEISVPSNRIRHVTEALLLGATDLNKASPPPLVKMAGLGARDSLRLEAGLCLYGTDIDAKTTPIEAGLAWLVAKRRRNEQNFPGAQHICNELKTGTTHRRIGLQMLGENVPPARAGVQIFHKDKLVGHVTSGCPSPSLDKNIAMGYIAEALKAPGVAVQLKIREKFYDAAVVKMPFIQTNYRLMSKK